MSSMTPIVHIPNHQANNSASSPNKPRQQDKDSTPGKPKHNTTVKTQNIIFGMTVNQTNKVPINKSPTNERLNKSTTGRPQNLETQRNGLYKSQHAKSMSINATMGNKSVKEGKRQFVSSSYTKSQRHSMPPQGTFINTVRPSIGCNKSGSHAKNISTETNPIPSIANVDANASRSMGLDDNNPTPVIGNAFQAIGLDGNPTPGIENAFRAIGLDGNNPKPGIENADVNAPRVMGLDDKLLKDSLNQHNREDTFSGNKTKVPKKKSIAKKIRDQNNKYPEEYIREDMHYNDIRPDGRISLNENSYCRIDEKTNGKMSKIDADVNTHINNVCKNDTINASSQASRGLTNHSDNQNSAFVKGIYLDSNCIDSVSRKETSIGVLPHNNSFGSDSGAKPKFLSSLSNDPMKHDVPTKTDPTCRVHAETDNALFHIDIRATSDSIISLDVDVIVSSDDPTLRSKGMVAQVISKQGGGLLEECKQCIRQICPHISTWTLQPTPAVGKLKNKHVFHAVVKPFSQQNQSEWIDGLQSLITEIIFRAEHMGYESLAIPLLGTGKNGAPTDLVIGLLCATIEEYAGKPRPIFCLQSVTIVHPSKKIKDEIKKALKVRTNCPSKQKPTNKEKTSNNRNPKEIFLKVDSKLKETCPICLEEIKGSDLRQLSRCLHLFCKKCITESFKLAPTCPLCNMVYGEMTGTQPQGLMVEAFLRDVKLPSYDECGTICLMYLFEGGIQSKAHPNPGRQYKGTKRTAYLPDNADGQKVHRLLRKAFSQRLVFTIGASRTTGKEDVVTWNDIHHKTSIHGGTAKFGYPDPDYLSRVLDELAAKGITED